MNLADQKIHFITGRLAEGALRAEVSRLAARFGFQFTVQVLPISVAALLTPQWIAARIEVPTGTTQVLIPGYVRGDLDTLQAATFAPIRPGPKDLRDLEEFLGGNTLPPNLDHYDIKIIAEINHAPNQTFEAILAEAKQMSADGADLIDVGCLPGQTWQEVGACVEMLREQGLRVSIDSLNVEEIAIAARSGAELVLSVNSSNRAAAADWDIEVVVIPDDPRKWEEMESTIEFLDARNVPFRIDPILEPIGFGFGESLMRYMSARRRWPQTRMMMGIGNLTELSDVDSAGINFLLISLCQELGIGSVLTTQVINWARTSVKECNWARRIAKYAIARGIPPKRLSDRLLMLRDSRIREFTEPVIEELAREIRDGNYRILVSEKTTHVLGLKEHVQGVDPFSIFDRIFQAHPENIDPSHAFYLGYELCKAELAIQLGKQYTQDEPLHWGFLTAESTQKHRLSRRKNRDA
jgi:dihydropteroate synthase-like protein